MAVTGTFTFENCDQEAWDKIFNSPKTPEEFRDVKRKLEEENAKREIHENASPAVHGDDAARRMYAGFDHGLGVHIDPHRPRAHRREVMKAKDLRCVGEHIE